MAAAAADDAARFMDWVQTLSSVEMEGRGPGTAGIDRARDMLVDQLRQWRGDGLAPAFGGEYLQPFEADLGVEATRQSLSGRGRDARAERDFTVLGLSATAAFAGEAVFVGYGIVEPQRRYHSFAGLEEAGLAGKVAIAFRYEPMDDRGQSRWSRRGPWSDAASLANKATWAAQRGATALLVVNPPGMDNTNQLRPTAATAFDKAAAIPVLHVSSSWLADVLQAGEITDGRAFLREMQARADRGRDRPVALPGVTISGDVAIQRRRAMLHNIAAVLPGAGDLAGQWVIVGAHYDHLGYGDPGSMTQHRVIHPGADDNASGTAGVLLLARRMSAAVAQDDGKTSPRRSVMFVLFSGEERGLLGSMHFVRQMHELGLTADNVVAMVNLDMIGRLRDEKLHVFGVETAQGLAEVVKATGKARDLKLSTTGSGLGMSDHTAFYFKRIPALHFFTGIHEDYHKPTDTADRIDAAGGVRVMDMVGDVVLQLSQRQTRLAFVEVEDAHGGHGMGMPSRGAVLGIMPDYDTLDGDHGCGISGLAPGGPAAKAGLRDGDIITAWNAAPIANVRDLTAQLAQAHPGDTVRLTLRRGDETRQATVTLGSR